VSKARYGTLLKQLGGWGWMQDLLRVRGRNLPHDVISVDSVKVKPELMQPPLG
jgi:hypothetical protein